MSDRFEIAFDDAPSVPPAARSADLLASLWQGRLVLESVAAVGATSRPPRPGGIDAVIRRPDTVATSGGGSGSVPAPAATPAAAAPQRLSLTPVPLPGNPPRATCRVGDDGRLADRMLYDVLFVPPAGPAEAVVAAHAVYAKRSWSTFGLAHITDLHLAARNDRYRAKLAELGLKAGAANFNNFNNNVRDFVRWANDRHAAGELDVVMATGDLIDYVHEDGDENPRGPGNFKLFEDILLGRSAYPAFPGEARPAAEELRVPVLTTLGNHDYRAYPYPLVFTLAIPYGTAFGVKLNELGVPLGKRAGKFLGDVVGAISGALGGDTDYNVKDVTQFESFGLTVQEAVALVGGKWEDGGRRFDVKNYLPEAAGRSVLLDEGVRTGASYYFRRICRQRSFVMPLGGSRHRLVVLDSGHDVGIVTSVEDALAANLGDGTEDQQTFLGGGPNSEGVRQSEIDQVNRALAAAGPDGLVLVGVHAPLINPAGNEYPYYFRQTEHPTADRAQTAGFVARNGPPDGPRPTTIDHRSTAEWPETGTAHFKRGAIDRLLDNGVSRGRGPELVTVCAGGGPSGRPVDLVMAGHVHRHVEMHVSRDPATGDLLHYLDFYSENPRQYYPSKEVYTGADGKRGTREVRLEVTAGAGTPGQSVADPGSGASTGWSRRIPTNPRTLAAAAGDPVAARAWWAEFRPLVVQTAPLGPTEVNQRPDRDVRPGDAPGSSVRRPIPAFQGVRLVSVKDDAIVSMRNVTVADLRRTLT